MGELAPFRLAYGRAELHPQAPARVADPSDLDPLYDGDGARVRTVEWFTGRKRALLAPYGLGTIDQALLGVLYAKHFFLRLYGLAGKTVVVDEVHAYDVYMNALLERLLPWLRALGSHVVLLSATLPSESRRALLNAWDPDAPLPADPDPAATGYPAVWASAGGVVSRLAGPADGLTADRSQRCTLRRGDPDPVAVARTAAEAVRSGAAVAVVCNTVARAQAVSQAVAGVLSDLAPEDRVLFHARFVRRERQRAEDHVLRRFGKGRPAGPAVLVGTQVIEQSLDLDIDLMLSDLAPVDLLLQRAGRLHRHDRPRPKAHAEPLLIWLCPSWSPLALPDVTEVSGHGRVYDQTALWRTARLLAGRDRWHLPGDYRPLIETVYGDAPVPPGLPDAARRQWETTADAERDRRLNSGRNAAARLIQPPPRLAEMLLGGQPSLADDDDEGAHRDLRAATREGESVEVVVLHAAPDGALFLDPDLAAPAPLPLPDPRPDRDDAVRALLGASVRLSHKRFVGHVLDRPDGAAPAAWNRAAESAPSLRGLHPVVMEGGVWSDAGPTLRWHNELGLLID